MTEIYKFSYNDYNIVRRLPKEIGEYWCFLKETELNSYEGFLATSELDGTHCGNFSKGECDWLLARDDSGYFLCEPKDGGSIGKFDAVNGTIIYKD